MDADCIVLVLSHQSDPYDRSHQVNEEHDEEKLHERVLVAIQETEAIYEGNLAFYK